MVQIFFTQKVDGDAWVKSWDDDSEDGVPKTFERGNIKVLGKFRGNEDPNIIGLLVEAESNEAFLEFGRSCYGNPNFTRLSVEPDSTTRLFKLD